MANLLTTNEAAELLGVTVKTVNLLARAGRIPTAHKGAGRTSARIFNRDDVERIKRERAA